MQNSVVFIPFFEDNRPVKNINKERYEPIRSSYGEVGRDGVIPFGDFDSRTQGQLLLFQPKISTSAKFVKTATSGSCWR